MLALKKKREAEKKAAAENNNGDSKKVSLLGVDGKKNIKSATTGKKRTPGEIRIQKGKKTICFGICCPFRALQLRKTD